MSETKDTGKPIRVWDYVVRVTHWGLVLCFVAAYVSEDEFADLHVSAGYLVGLLVIVRLAWGIIGSETARFRTFLQGKAAVVGNLRELVEFHPRRHLGHGPAAGWMIVALLAGLTLSVASGWLAHQPSRSPAAISTIVDATGDGSEISAVVERVSRPGLPWDEIHEISANLTGLLIIAHVLAVVLVSWLQKENLVKSMFTGRKRAD